MPKNGIIAWGWNDMEELLLCPVCLDVPVIGIVEQCRHGHHICANCKTKVDNCPLCKCDFHGTRNYVVEELVRHYEELKNTMLLNNIELESQPIKKVKAKLEVSTPTFVPNVTPRRKFNTPNPNKGNYPCRAGDCNTVLPASRLLNHVRTCHADILTESMVDFTDSYNQTWIVPFKNRKLINRSSYIIFVRGIGLIFLNLEILRSGHLIATIQMGIKFNQAQNFLACIEFFGGPSSHSYNTRLISVRENIVSLLQKRNCYTLSKPQLRNICVNKKFNCKITLSHYNVMDSNILTLPNTEQINIVAGIRASLILEEKDKKLIKELEGSNKAKSITYAGLNEPVNQRHGQINEMHKSARDTLMILSNDLPTTIPLRVRARLQKAKCEVEEDHK